MISLDLRENQLTSLPGEIGQLQSLKHLDLAYNPISNVEQKKIRQLLPGRDIQIINNYGPQPAGEAAMRTVLFGSRRRAS